MPCTIGIGKQDFASLREGNYFYIDKTKLISQWWESGDSVTLITRPRRFGKTLNMSMMNCFFSNQYADRQDLFTGLEIWNEEKYQSLQGSYPVIFLSFAAIKADNLQDTKKQIKAQITEVYRNNRYLLDGALLSEQEKKEYEQITKDMGDAECSLSIRTLCSYLFRYYGKKTIVLLDEYDTPMQEAYIHGYWKEFTSFIRSLFNSTFKTNPYLERGMMTGITRVSKESVFSDLNNLSVITTTSERYADCFGFTEAEVFASLEQFGLIEKKKEVKRWYDGFTFGSKRDIYNPWSITNFLREKTFMAYWAATSGNVLINKLIRTASAEIKEGMEDLLQGREIVVTFDEQIVFDQLDHAQNAIWSLLVASGYLRVEQVEYRGAWRKPWYHLMITNLETLGMFSDMFAGWFENSGTNYNAFIEALLKGNIKEMNAYMNDVALTTFSSFDTGNHPSERTQPERFYHGFVLGLLVELQDTYLIRSNRESGLGRYDVMLIPQKPEFDGIILEFKVRETEEEASLGDTVCEALKQIKEKQYDRELIAHGVPEDRIRCYGFAFEGKRVLIGAG
ncbi:AAA family ATPase [Ventrimonas sp. CLA-AP-H27]|uniref:AAA family ATPase n=1 Tax=Ventrimonas faecis TaxID=3133170 RepID=A0ABV1HHE1_9FIRM